MNSTRAVFIRFDASRVVGLGHWYRCVALAEELRRRGVQVVLLVNPLDAALSGQLKQKGVAYRESESWTPQEIRRAMGGSSDSIVILDLMNTPVDLVEDLRQSNCVMTIGGSGPGRDHADVRIDGMIPRPGYGDSFKGAAYYVGPEYLILRESFANPARRKTRENVTRLLVALGGDAHETGLTVARHLSFLYPAMEISVLLGPLAKCPAPRMDRVIVHHAVENPRPLLENCDIALTSGGMTAYEAMSLGTPLLLVPQVPLQEITSRAFVEAGVGRWIPRAAQSVESDFQHALKQAIDELSSFEVRRECAARGSALVDGKGLYRVADLVHALTLAARE